MNYYHSLITTQSWEELKKLKQKIKFILIGGWAVFLYTKELKSKDIDILVEFEELGKLKKEYEVSKNERLRKYEARREAVQIDVYLPFYSFLGIPVKDLMAQTVSLEGFTVLKQEWLFCLKLYVLSLRARSAKGEKDFLDLISLFKNGVEPGLVKKIIQDYNLTQAAQIFQGLLAERVEAKEIGLNRQQFKKIKTDLENLFSGC